MMLVFCCPTCGATLRVPPALAPAAINCPQCSDTVRVPRAPHPIEASDPGTCLSQSACATALSGSQYLSASVWMFGLATLAVLLALTLRLAISARASETPDWVFTLIQTSIVFSASLLLIGGAFRAWGYLRFAPALLPLGLDGWCRASAVGGLLTAIGAVSLAPRLIGANLHPLFGAILIVGVAGGLLGSILEFAFLPPLHRLLSDSAGWQAANRVNRYAVSFVFTIVATMAVLGGGLVVTVLAFGGKANQPGAILTPPPEARIAAIVTLASLIALILLACVRYARLLSHTRRSLAPLQPVSQVTVRQTDN